MIHNDQQVSEGRSTTIMKNVGYQAWSTLNEFFSRLSLTIQRNLQKLGWCGHSVTSYWVLHVVYYGALTIAGTISLWWCRGKRDTISVVDCIFNAVSALTNTGLSSVLLRDFAPLGMFVIMALMFLGHTVFVSLLPVFVRRVQISRQEKAHTSASKPVDQISETGEGIQRHGDIGINSEIGRETCDHGIGVSLERQALVTLSWLVPIYMTIFLCFGFVTVLCYTSFEESSKVKALYEAEEVNPISAAMFLSISAFSNTGLSPLDDNMVPFASSPLVLLPLAALILAGNSCMFPPTLRFIIWCLSKRSTDDSQRNVYKYLLRFPRRCHPLLFPQVHTTWLVASVVAFNAVDLVAFCALEWNSPAVTEGELSDSNAAVKLIGGLFQSLNTRSAGMNILQLSSLSPPLLVLFTAMMGIGVYPVFLSRQHSRLTRTDVDVGVSEKIAPTDHAAADKSLLLLQFRKLFTTDSATIFVHIFLICTVEIRSINSDPLNYSIFSIVFEVISAYGNVGLSLGYWCKEWERVSASTPQAHVAVACRDVPYSFSGKWRAGSKLVLVGVMLVGRHRNLPGNMDCAISCVPSLCGRKSCGKTLQNLSSEC